MYRRFLIEPDVSNAVRPVDSVAPFTAIKNVTYNESYIATGSGQSHSWAINLNDPLTVNHFVYMPAFSNTFPLLPSITFSGSAMYYPISANFSQQHFWSPEPQGIRQDVMSTSRIVSGKFEIFSASTNIGTMALGGVISGGVVNDLRMSDIPSTFTVITQSTHQLMLDASRINQHTLIKKNNVLNERAKDGITVIFNPPRPMFSNPTPYHGQTMPWNSIGRKYDVGSSTCTGLWISPYWKITTIPDFQYSMICAPILPNSRPAFNISVVPYTPGSGGPFVVQRYLVTSVFATGTPGSLFPDIYVTNQQVSFFDTPTPSTGQSQINPIVYVPPVPSNSISGDEFQVPIWVGSFFELDVLSGADAAYIASVEVIDPRSSDPSANGPWAVVAVDNVTDGQQVVCKGEQFVEYVPLGFIEPFTVKSNGERTDTVDITQEMQSEDQPLRNVWLTPKYSQFVEIEREELPSRKRRF